MNEIMQLKAICHSHFERYVKSTLRVENDKKHYNKQRRKAYHRLAQELRTDAHKAHFHNMNTTEELEKALTVLKTW